MKFLTRPRHRGNRSLVQHLTASLFCVLAASAIAISSIVFFVLYEKSEAQFEQRASESLTHLSNSLESYLWHMEEESVVSLCDAFSKIDIVVFINVVDHRGNEVYSFGEVEEGVTIVKGKSVSYEDVEVGYIQLGLTPLIFEDKVYETTWISLLSLLFVAIVLGVFTKLILNKNLRTPLDLLIARIESISAGEYAEHEEEGNLLEMRTILSKFNEMAGKVRSREDLLRLSEEKYRRLFETTTEGIIVIDKDRRLIMVNKVLADMLGYIEMEMYGMPIADLLHPDDLEHHDQEMEKRVQGLSSQYERRLMHKDGHIVWTIVSSSPMIGMKGAFDGSFGMITDISDLRRAQAELKIAYDEMEQRVILRTDELNKTNRLLTSEIHIRKQTEKAIIDAKEAAEDATRAKSEFLANMSHEIRTPMNAIIGMTHLTKMTNLSATQKDYLNKIDISAKSLLGIINDVLDMSKIEAGMLSVESVGFTIDQVLEQLTTIVSPRANEKKLEFLINVDKKVPNSVVGDSMRLAQILINLCNNAVKFTDEGAVVVSIVPLELKQEQAKLRFTVKDDGIGIKLDQIDELFQPFTQADASTTRKYGGTGLGLNLCNQLVSLMGGEIGVESEPGKGSLFWFEIPFPIYHRDKEPALLPGELQGQRALVVDDNDTSQIILKGMLEHMGLRVALAGSGEEALEILRNVPKEEAFNLLVIDWRMPGRNGIQTAGAILSDESISPKPPMFMVSAYGNASLVKKSNEMGFKGLLFKPVNQSFLFNLVVETLGKGMVTTSDSVVREGVTDNLGGARVLLVEDNEINRQVALEILASAKIKVFEAVNGQAALDFLDKTPVDLVLMDVQMPIMDGYEATRRLREQDRFNDLPIIAMTAHAMVEDIERSQSVGMNGHVAKPFDPEDLFKVLAQWIEPTSVHQSRPLPLTEEPVLGDSLPASMDGIDVQLGLRRARGNKELYKNLLLLLDEKYSDAAQEIEQARAEGRLEEAVGLAHSVKGTSGMLGAMELFESSSDLEHALDESSDDVQEKLERFSYDMSVVMQSIAVIKEIEGTKTVLKQVGEVADAADLLASLEALKVPLSEGAPVVCRKKAKDVQVLVWPGELHDDVARMLKLIAEYDFKKALVLVKDLEKRMV
nr:response regulator [Pseudodesulfovibrio sp.]